MKIHIEHLGLELLLVPGGPTDESSSVPNHFLEYYGISQSQYSLSQSPLQIGGAMGQSPG